MVVVSKTMLRKAVQHESSSDCYWLCLVSVGRWIFFIDSIARNWVFISGIMVLLMNKITHDPCVIMSGKYDTTLYLVSCRIVPFNRTACIITKQPLCNFYIVPIASKTAL